MYKFSCNLEYIHKRAVLTILIVNSINNAFASESEKTGNTCPKAALNKSTSGSARIFTSTRSELMTP